MWVISEALENKKLLKDISFRNNSFGDIGATKLAESILDNVNIFNLGKMSKQDSIKTK